MLQHVLDTIVGLKERGIWTEVVTLIVPGFNDDPRELREIAKFLAGVSRDIPWHVTAFHQDYKMRDHDNTTADKLLLAANIGREEGLRYVYAGNIPGHVADFENTRCPSCNEVLIKRVGYLVQSDKLTGRGKCHVCDTAIPGIWN